MSGSGKTVGPKATFKPNFSWVGSALGWGVRRFHNNIYMFYKTQQNVVESQTPYQVFTIRLVLGIHDQTGFVLLSRLVGLSGNHPIRSFGGASFWFVLSLNGFRSVNHGV